MTCLLTLSSCSVNRTSGKDALFNLMDRRANTHKQVELELACSTLHSPPRLLSNGSPFPFFPEIVSRKPSLAMAYPATHPQTAGGLSASGFRQLPTSDLDLVTRCRRTRSPQNRSK